MVFLCPQQDTPGDHNAMLAVEEAGTHLLATLQTTSTTAAASTTAASTAASNTFSKMPPHLLVISGVLGPRAAAAASAAHSMHDLNQAERGVKALRKLLQHEVDRRAR